MGDMLKNRASLLSFISSVIESFLMKHGFVLRHDIGPTTLDSPSRKRRKFEKNFDDSGFTEGNSVSEPPISLHNHHSADGSNLVLYTSTVCEPFSPHIHSLILRQEDNPSDILWIDPITHEKFLVDARSENSYRQGDSQSGEPSSSIRQGRRILQHKHVTSSALDHPIPAWLQKALQVFFLFSGIPL
jgi:DNA mismatch repair protein MLH3